MSLPIVLRPEARSEFDAAADWYEQQRHNLGTDFIAEVQDVLARISESPELCPVVHQKVRRAVVARFPYCVYYRIEAESILVIAILHGRRDPRIWQKRI